MAVMNKSTLIWLLILIIIMTVSANAASFQIPTINLEIGESDESDDLVLSLKILLLLTVLTLAPAALVMMTAFTRIIIVLALIRNALAIRQMPPNQVLIGLALFLTIFIMNPIFQEINANALQPYLAGEIGQEEALTKALDPLRNFMFRQTREKDLALFIELSGSERPRNKDDVSTLVLIPAFVLSEIKTAFEIGFIIYIPFLIIDMFVASTLMSLGMMMLPPVMISLPFKLLLFILVDGWYLVIKSLITTFN
ncbi:flagellar biosynthetic protein FliP [Anoxybacter fermentans]|uniref:Flagellar biosynthetic protein FliP n=2 Tax=Anoxybacter fermentans TaxID=1323375 RepID=A0A3Q9HRS0_9FIRM|nr:flagellar biosynthetic protein FliP [Anoxybacter fermentans]